MRFQSETYVFKIPQAFTQCLITEIIIEAKRPNGKRASLRIERSESSTSRQRHYDLSYMLTVGFH